jgi:RNA polymerase sigma-70 factor (ECF subfamily)
VEAILPEYPETSESLIVQVRDPSNRAAWLQFEQLYRPVIFRIARAKGLQHADALDLVQQVLISVSSAIDRFEKQHEGVLFRNWLGRITRNAILKALSRRPRDRASGGSDVLDVLNEIPADPETEALINLEYRRELFQRAAQQVRGQSQEVTWLAFEMTELQQISIERTAALLQISTGSIYAARSRVMRRIRNTIQQLEESEAEKGTTDETNCTNV